MSDFVPSPLLAYDDMPYSSWETEEIKEMTEEFVAGLRKDGYTVKYIPNPVSLIYDDGEEQRVVIAAAAKIENVPQILEDKFKNTDDDIVYVLLVHAEYVIDPNNRLSKLQRFARFGHSSITHNRLHES